MELKLDQLINVLLSKSEQLEVDLKKKSAIEELSIKQLQCIELIDELENPTLSELSERLKITKPSTTVMIDRLADKGYVTKVKSDVDKRSAHVHLTSKGKEAGHLHENVHHAIAKHMTRNLTDSEKEILIVLLNKATKEFD
ncbi:MAG: MarR family transcriptional regulator [Prolixibacteraceae bacterium]|jgi:DNA-binding MarR family transcriptional regulator|nr:MarR family transcriptional regulator [Prolixibacteraceae bacterium]